MRAAPAQGKVKDCQAGLAHGARGRILRERRAAVSEKSETWAEQAFYVVLAVGLGALCLGAASLLFALAYRALA